MQNTNIDLENGMSILPIGISGFSQLIKKKKIYVDKTAILYSLVKDENFYFLSRPRRFGKTLLLNTFESLFKDGLKYFKGLAIESKWADTTYPVIHLDFSSCTDFNSIEEFKDEFLSILKDAVLAANLKFPPQDLEDPDSAQARFKCLSYIDLTKGCFTILSFYSLFCLSILTCFSTLF